MSRDQYQVTQQELLERLRETVSHMQRSARAYDLGDVSEARRLATSLRLLLKHREKGQTKALLQQLGLLDSIRFLDSGGPLIPGNLLPESPMVLIELSPTKGARFRPRLNLRSPFGPRWLGFREWWTMTVISDGPAAVKFSREELVLAVAEQDGGAHVDATLNAKYAALTRLNSYGWSVSQNEKSGPLRPIELAHMRQIAHEVLVSLTEHQRLQATIGGAREEGN